MESEACITGSQVKTQIPDGFQWKPLKDKSDTEGWQGGRYVISSRTFFWLVDYEVLGVNISSFLVISQLGSTCFWSACRQLLPPGGGFSICKTTQRIWQSSIVLEEESAGNWRETFHSWQRSWGRRLGIHKGGIKPQESPRIFSSIYPPKPESAYFIALCSHLWLYWGLSRTTISLSLSRVNLQLQLIKFLGIRSV